MCLRILVLGLVSCVAFAQEPKPEPPLKPEVVVSTEPSLEDRVALALAHRDAVLAELQKRQAEDKLALLVQEFMKKYSCSPTKDFTCNENTK